MTTDLMGTIYNNPKLAYEEDGFYSFDLKHPKPHAYWCVIKVKKHDVFVVPVFFDYLDNLVDTVAEAGCCQFDNEHSGVTLVIGRGVWRSKEDLGKPTMNLNPEVAKKAYKKILSWFK
jgi:hypothetical protein